MGNWGTGLYQNDIADDVRYFYKDQLRRGIAGPEITKWLIEDNLELLSSDDDAPDFWFALADTQWALGRLEEMVKENALHLIVNGSGLRRWQDSDFMTISKRKKVLQELKERLEAPQPPKKEIAQYRICRCQWRVGDVYAYPLQSNDARENGLQGEFLLLHKVGETVEWPGHTIPVVRVKITRDATLPTTGSEFDKLDYVQVSQAHPLDFLQGYLGGIFVDGKEVDNPCANQYDEVPIYCLRLLNTSKKIIPKNLIYVGNYSNIIQPSMEYISPKGDYPGFAWKFFEKIMIDRYCHFTARNT